MGRTEHVSCVVKREDERREAAGQLRQLLERIATDPACAYSQEVEVARLKKAAGLDDDGLRAMRIEVFAAHAHQAAADQDVSPEELKDLDAVMKALGLDTDAVRQPLREIGRYAVLHQVRAGKLPIIEVKGPLLEEGEPVHWATAAELYEEKVIRRYSQGGYSGISVPIYKGIRWHAGGYRTQPVVQTGMVATDHGNLFVTDRRVVYVGQQRSFSIPYKHVLAIQGYSDAVAVQKDGMTAKPVYFKNQDPELVSAILQLAISYSREPAHSGNDNADRTFKVLPA
jgi:hypothetical protein